MINLLKPINKLLKNHLDHACMDPNTHCTQQLLLVQLPVIEWHDQGMPDFMDFHLNKCMMNTNLLNVIQWYPYLHTIQTSKV